MLLARSKISTYVALPLTRGILQANSLSTSSQLFAASRATSSNPGYPQSSKPTVEDVNYEKTHANSDLDLSKKTGTEGVHFQKTAPFQRIEQQTLDWNNKPLGDYLLTSPVYTKEELDSVKILEFEKKTLSDRLANALVKLLRSSFDIVTGYKHREITPDVKDKPLPWLISKGYVLSEKQWLRRFIFLESVAGVPGFVASMLRHLRSLRRMDRDGGYINMLLAEAENERMHLMSFLAVEKPSIWMRAMVLGAQGVFFNLFFVSYLINPKICHRFTAVLEEEAVVTYTRAMKEIKAGYVPGWKHKEIPSIARGYWQLPADSTMLDLVMVVRADESNHRFTNHTLSELDLNKHLNPLSLQEPDAITRGTKLGFTREESAAWLAETSRAIQEKKLEGTYEKSHHH
ncbi:alternative oxidase, partial [Wallemia mellicola CBS 633.66]